MQRNRKDDHLWQTSDPTTVFSSPVMDVLSSRVVCRRNGATRNYYRLGFTPWVNIVAITPEQQFVCIEQYRFGSGQIEMEIPGGAVEPGEDPLAAGLRELEEETGFTGDNARLIGQVCPNPAIQDNLCYTVLVENAKQTAAPRPDEMEDIEVTTLSKEELSGRIVDGTINHGLVLNALMFYWMTKSELFCDK